MPDLFDKREITLGDMIACARRELAMRQASYPKFTAQGSIERDVAVREIAVMRAIIERLVADEIAEINFARNLNRRQSYGTDGRHADDVAG